MKTSKPGIGPTIIHIHRYVPNKDICPLLTLKEYLRQTKDLRGDESQLFISYHKPHKGVSRDTISRWVKHVLEAAGIKTSIYTPHSTRAASTSKAHMKSVPLDVIMKAAGWHSATTFNKFYNKPIPTDANMTTAVLS